MLKLAIELGLNLQTNTPVTAVKAAGAPERWKVETGFGSIETDKVIHATNAYASNLLPEVSGIIVPGKGHAVAIPPPLTYEMSPLKTTMAAIWDNDYDYVIQRQGKGKHLIIGGRDSIHPAGFAGSLGDSDDSVWNNEIFSALKRFPEDNYEGWDGKGEVEEAQCWTGIMGFSKDALPFVGELPGKSGQLIAAGFSGHGKCACRLIGFLVSKKKLICVLVGMARIFLAVKALCQYMCGEDIDERVPRVYFDLERRTKGEIDLVKLGFVKE